MARGNKGERDRGGDHEHEQDGVEVGEEDAERKDRAQVRDEACRQDRLAEFPFREPGLDHHRVDHGHRRRRERDPRDLRRLELPPGHEVCEREDGRERREEGDRAHRQRHPDVAPEQLGVDLRAGEEGQQPRAEPGEDVDPGVVCRPAKLPRGRRSRSRRGRR